jgi:hypothetical protein
VQRQEGMYLSAKLNFRPIDIIPKLLQKERGSFEPL